MSAWLAEERRKKIVKTEDELMQGPASPSLEDFRFWKSKTEELEYKRKLGLLVPLDELKRVWQIYGARLRTGLEAVGRSHGKAVADDISTVVDELYKDIERQYGKARTRTPARHARRRKGTSRP